MADRIENIELEEELTKEEIVQLTYDLALHQKEIVKYKRVQARVKKIMSERKKKLTDKFDNVLELILEKHEKRSLECRVFENNAMGNLEWIRIDTGEVVKYEKLVKE